MSLVDELKSELYAANRLCSEADARRREVEGRLAEAIAAELGLQVGSIVVEKKSIGYGSTKRIQERRFRVESFRYKSYGKPPLEIWGRSLRKDGTEGEKWEIYGAWTLEAKAEERNAGE